MKISLFAHLTDIVNEIGIERAADRLAECGYTGAEFFYTQGNVPDKELGYEYRAVLDLHGITVPCVSCYASIVTNDTPDEPCKNAIAALKKCADLTSALGAKYLHHTVYPCMDKDTALSYGDLIDAAVRGCAEVAEYARSVGVTLLYEPQGLVFNGKDGFVGFYRRLKSLCDNIAVCFDVGNSYWVGEEPFPILDEIKSDVVHVHLKDYAAMPGGDSDEEPREVTLGDGTINIKRIVSELRAIGYDGFFSVEDATDTPIEEKCKLAKAKIV